MRDPDDLPPAPDAAPGPADDDGSDDPAVPFVDRRRWARQGNEGGAADGRAGGDAAGKPAYVEELERRLADQEAAGAAQRARYAAATQDLDAARARLTRELARDLARETRAILSSFLDVVDDLDRAVASAERTLDRADAPTDPDQAGRTLLQGVVLVRQKFLAVLAQHGVARFDAEGQPFDPTRHNAISTVPVDDPARVDIVADVFTPGYRIHDDVLRHAGVTVGRLSPDAAAAPPDADAPAPQAADGSSAADRDPDPDPAPHPAVDAAGPAADAAAPQPDTADGAVPPAPPPPPDDPEP